MSALVLLDLSAAFDTVDHKILLTRLSTFFGIKGSALDLLSSYLQDRTQAVVIDSYPSPTAPLTTGVPQGSVLGLLLFTLYTTPLAALLQSSGLLHHMYADDTQLYISFSAKDSISALAHLTTTLESVHAWLTRNRLALNPSKTEFLLIGLNRQREKVNFNSFSFAGSTVSATSSARNLGVIFDSELSFDSHISSVTRSCYHIIRQLRQIRPLLDHNTAVSLANSLVSSRLDFCNSLFYGLPDTSMR